MYALIANRILIKQSGNIEKYEGAYFDHWLAMYNAHQDEVTIACITNQIEVYLGFENRNEFKLLQEETKQILANDDLQHFNKRWKSFSVADLQLMVKVILET